jgi:hypothetical protein
MKKGIVGPIQEAGIKRRANPQDSWEVKYIGHAAKQRIILDRSYGVWHAAEMLIEK